MMKKGKNRQTHISPIKYKIVDDSAVLDENNGVKNDAIKDKKLAKFNKLKRTGISPWSSYQINTELTRHEKIKSQILKNESKIFNRYFAKMEHVKTVDACNDFEDSVLYKHKLGITNILAIDRNKIISSSFDSKVLIYDIADEKKTVFSGHYKGVTDIFVSLPYFYSIGFDKRIKIWDLRINRCIYKKLLSFVPLKIYVEANTTEENDGCSNSEAAIHKKVYKTRSSSSIKNVIFGTSTGIIVTNSTLKTIKNIHLGFVLDIRSVDLFFIVLTACGTIHMVDKADYQVKRTFNGVVCFTSIREMLYIGYKTSITAYNLYTNACQSIKSNDHYLITTCTNEDIIVVKSNGDVDLIRSMTDMVNMCNIDSISHIISVDGNNVIVSLENGSIKKIEK